MPIREHQSFDLGALEAYLRKHGFSGPLGVQQFKGGQSNPTYLISGAGKHHVLRAKPGPAAKLLPSAHAVEREFRVITALGQAGIPVPRTYCLCEDESVIGRAFYVMEYVEGRVLWDQALPHMTPPERAAIYDEMNRVIAWLPENIPARDETTVVHGDYRMDNLIFHPREPRILAVLDWELSTLGDPLADFSYHCMSWHIPPGQFRGIAGLALAALGIPDEAQYIASYCKRTGREGIEHWDFYLAYNLFRIAAILQGVMKRALEGTAASAQALEAGRRARPLAELGWQYAEKATRNA